MSRSDLEYSKAFRDYGMDVDTFDPAEAAKRIRSGTICNQLAAGLDAWAFVRHYYTKENKANWVHLLAIARAADPDPVRCQIRDAWERSDADALEQMAGEAQTVDLAPSTIAAVASALRQHGRGDQTIALLRPAQQRHPNDFWINHKLAIELMGSQPAQVGEAISFYRAALGLRPNSPGVHLNLGNALRQQGKLAEAEFEYRQALRLKPDYATAHNNLGNLLNHQGKLVEAEAAYREAIRLKPDYANAHVYLGTALGSQGKLGEAEAAYREAIRLKPDLADAHHALGLSLERLGNLAEAENAYREAVRLKPDYADAYVNLGALLCDDKRDYSGAITAFREAIRHKPDLAVAHYNLGNSLKPQGMITEAEKAFQEAIRFKPDYAEAHVNLGVLWAEQGKLDEAEAEARQAIRHKPDLAQGHNLLGGIFVAKRRFDEAIAAGREAIRLKPDYADVHANLAWLLATCADPKFRDPRQAVEHSEKAVKLRRHANDWNILGTAYYRAGDWKNSVEALEKADQMLNGSDYGLCFFLAMAHWQLGNQEHTRKYYQQAVEWMEQDQNRLRNDELRRFRVEAEELMGSQKQQPESSQADADNGLSEEKLVGQRHFVGR